MSKPAGFSAVISVTYQVCLHS